MTEQAQVITEWRCPACGGPTYPMQIGEPVMRKEPRPGRPDLPVEVFTGCTKYTHYRYCQNQTCRLLGKQQKAPTVSVEVED